MTNDELQILIVKLSSIGDVIHTLPVLAAIRRALPSAEISWAVEKGTAAILRDNQLLANLIEIDTRGLRREKSWAGKWHNLRQQRNQLKGRKFDIAIDFQGLLKSSLITQLSGAAERVGFAKESLREPASRFLLTKTVEVQGKFHIIEKNLRLAEKALQIEVSADPQDYEFPIATTDEHWREAAKVIGETGENFVILNPGGGWATKLWAAEKFGVLADRIFTELNLKSVINFGPGEEALAKRVLGASQTRQTFAASLSLKGFYELSKCAMLYVGGDTGPTHLAIAAGTPVVGIFGPTEWQRNGSPRTTDICVERFDIGCREDCHRRVCRNWICLDIEVETVLRQVKKRLESAQAQTKMERFEIV